MPIQKVEGRRRQHAAAAATVDAADVADVADVPDAASTADSPDAPLDVAAVRRALRSARAPCPPLVNPWLLRSGDSIDAGQRTRAERASGRPNRELREAAASLRGGRPRRALLEPLVTCAITRGPMRVPARLWALPPAAPLWDDRPYELEALTAWVGQAGRSPQGEPLDRDVAVVPDRALAALARALDPSPGDGDAAVPRLWIWRAPAARCRWVPARPALLLFACLMGAAHGLRRWRDRTQAAGPLPLPSSAPELGPWAAGHALAALNAALLGAAVTASSYVGGGYLLEMLVGGRPLPPHTHLQWL